MVLMFSDKDLSGLKSRNGIYDCNGEILFEFQAKGDF